MATLLDASGGEAYQLYNEIDHLVSFACQSWDLRGGGVGTRDPHVQAKVIRIIVGEEGELFHAPRYEGTNATPPASPSFGFKRADDGWSPSLRFAGASLASAHLANAHGRSAAEGTLGRLEEEFHVPDYLVVECPYLSYLRWRRPGSRMQLSARREPAHQTHTPPGLTSAALLDDPRATRSAATTSGWRTSSSKLPRSARGSGVSAQLNIDEAALATDTLRSLVDGRPRGGDVGRHSLPGHLTPRKDKQADDGTMAPIRRPAALFRVVIVLIKMRWLVRLHCALMSFGGQRCSLIPLMEGVLTDICGVHDRPHSPAQVFDSLIETLRTRFSTRWPLFMAYVGMYENAPPRGSLESLTPPQEWLQSMRATADTSAPGSPSKDGVQLPRMWQLCDDIFLAWLAQQDASKITAVQSLRELEAYGLVPPDFRVNLKGLREWRNAANVDRNKTPLLRASRRDAHHLVLMVGWKAARDRAGISSAEVMELARTVVENPKTFNPYIRNRLAHVLSGVGDGSELANSVTLDLDDEQLSSFQSFAATPRDCGRLNPFAFGRDQDLGPPALVGRESRYMTEAKVGALREPPHWIMADLRTTVKHPSGWKL